MIITRLIGGLGNQMFQYAAALRLAMRHDAVVKFDLSFLEDRTDRGFTLRDFDLVIFNLAEKAASAREVRKYRRLIEPATRTRLERIADKFSARHFYLEKHQTFQPEVLGLPDDTYLEGYFQNERYFGDVGMEIRKHFRLTPDESMLSAETRLLADEIRTAGGTCLHVRRGDYVSNPIAARHHGVCGLEYYRRGLEKLRSLGSSVRVFVFSDDSAWCHENFKPADGFTVVGQEHAGPRASTHLWLMTLCQHFLIANSSFAWWAAWLGQDSNKIVIRPSRWFRAPELKDAEICPPSWLEVSND